MDGAPSLRWHLEPPPTGRTIQAFAAAADDPALDVIDFPVETRQRFFMGSEGTYDPALFELAQNVYEPMTKTEMVDALHSPARLRQHASLIQVPVQFTLGQDEKLWTATPNCVTEYRQLHSAAPFVDARVTPNVGHNIDQHHLGPALHLRQLGPSPPNAPSGQRRSSRKRRRPRGRTCETRPSCS